MCESGSGGGISKIISWHIDGLDGGNGTSLGGGNSLLESTEISGKSGLVTYSRWDTTEKGRHFRASLGESENVVDEQKHVLVLFISEVLSDGKTSETDTSSGTWGLVHLTVHESGLRLVRVEVDDTRLNHFVEEIVTLTSTLTDTGEHRVTTVSLSDVVNKLHNEHGFTDTGTTEKTNLTTSGVRGQKIDDLNTSNEEFGTLTLINESGGFSVDGSVLISGDGTALIDRLTNDIDDSTEGLGADGNHNGVASVDDILTTHKTLSGVESNGAHIVSTQMLGDFEDKTRAGTLDLKGVEDRGQLSFEFDVNDGTNDLRNFSVRNSVG